MLWEPEKMKKLAIACTAAALMTLAACGGQPEAEADNASNIAVTDELDLNAADAIDNAANEAAAVDNAAALENVAQ